MRRKSILSFVLVALILITSFSVILPVQAKSDTKRQIVVFKDNVDTVKKDKILKKHEALKVKEIKGTNAVVVMASSDNKISTDENIRFVEEDYVISIEGNSNKKDKKTDDQLPEQPAETIPWGVEYMNNLSSDSINIGNGIKIGIIDTGIDVDHPDLVDNIKGGYNATSKKKSFDDDNGHGTHVAGIIAALDNEIGVIGVAPEVDLYAVKALDSTGDGYISDVIEGIEWCIDNDVDIINMSIGIEMDSNALHETVIRADELGITMVAAAGNNYGGSNEYPANYAEVIGVGALTISGEIATLSAIYGVDEWAPGLNVFSTTINGDYCEMSGTSMAAPHWIKKLLN